MMKRM
jgi:hypothetical protein